MTIVLSPALETALRAAASRQGVQPEELAVTELEQRFLPPDPRDEWERRLRSIGVDCGVSLSDEAVSSEGLYD